MNEPLILLELLIEHLHVEVIAWLDAKELKIIDFSKQIDVFQILARVARQLFVRMIACSALSRETARVI